MGAPQEHVKVEEPVIVMVTGVAGSGKSTIGALLAARLGWTYADADTFHPPANTRKMSTRVPLTDDDRQPWLQAVGRWMDDAVASGRSAVLACSAIKRRYRDSLRAGRPHVHTVFLDADIEVIRSRLRTRRGHFFPPELVGSQFADLERPTAEENVVTVQAEESVERTVWEILCRTGLRGSGGG